MTADELRASVAASRKAQGLPPTVDDASTLNAVLTLLGVDARTSRGDVELAA